MSWRQSIGKFGLLLVFVLGWSLAGCGPTYPKCNTDKDCRANQQGQAEHKLYCVNGLCQMCRNNADCKDPSMECNAGMCEKIPGYCVSTSDCSGNQKCRNNRCGPECLSDSDCPSGSQCKGGDCVKKAQCSTNADCKNGQVCQGGQCVAAPKVQCQFKTIYFAYDSATLDDTARQNAQDDAKCVKQRNEKILLAGNTDERGTTEYNLALGERRARTVYNYLTSLGVDPSLLSTISYGEEQLARQCGEDGPDSCQKWNRRVEFSVK